MWREYLIEMDNYSEFCRDAIINEINKINSGEYIDTQIKEHKQEIQRLQGLKKAKPINEEKIQECLQYWHDAFEDKTFLDDNAFIKVIEKRVLPNVKKLGYKGSSQDICELFLNWPEGDLG